MATATTVTICGRNASGQSNSWYCTASDVTTAAIVFPSGGTELSLSSQPMVITDMIFGSASGDCSQLQMYVNGINTGRVIVKAANAYTTLQRQVLTNPIVIPAGATVKFIQVT
jgi:hypothetical protein